MSRNFFHGSYKAKVDAKNRFVLPQHFRYQLVEDGVCEFCLGLSLGGSIAIYRKKDMDEIVGRFRALQHVAKFQKFFTLFFSTLTQTTCDKIGRVSIPSVLKDGTNIESDIILAGALNKIEIWPKEVYEKDLSSFLEGKGLGNLEGIMQEAFLGNLEPASEKQALENVEKSIENLQTQTMKG